MPTSPESDGEIYLTPNTSVSIDDEQKDDVDGVQMRPPPRSKNGYRIDKIQSMSSIANNKDALIENRVEQRTHDNNDGQNGFIYRMNSLGNLSQYERDFGSTPKSLLKLKEEFENRRIAMLEQRNSLNNSLKNTDGSEKNGLFVRQRMHRKRFGIGDTKYIGTDNDTPESKQYHLTKMKSLGTISDSLVNERITYDPFLTPMIPRRRHPASLHSFEEEDSRNDFNSDSGSSDEQENFLRHQPDENVRFMHESTLLKGSFEREFRRSYNKKHDRPTSTTATGLRQSDGCFKMPMPVDKSNATTERQHQKKNRSSVHSLPSDGKCDVTRYEAMLVHFRKKKNKIHFQHWVLSFPFIATENKIWQHKKKLPNKYNNSKYQIRIPLTEHAMQIQWKIPDDTLTELNRIHELCSFYSFQFIWLTLKLFRFCSVLIFFLNSFVAFFFRWNVNHSQCFSFVELLRGTPENVECLVLILIQFTPENIKQI